MIMYYFIRCPKCDYHDLNYKNNKYECCKCGHKFSNKIKKTKERI